MINLILIVVLVWMVLSAIILLSLCIMSSRFNQSHPSSESPIYFEQYENVPSSQGRQVGAASQI